MKKSLLLSIVMTLVLVVAMSTATFAWYTANKQATVNATEITANTAGSSILVADAADGEFSTSMTLAAAGKLDPAAPLAKAEEKTYAQFTDINNWVNGTYDDNTSSATTTAVTTFANSVYTDSIFLRNDGGATVTLNITANYSATGLTDDADALVETKVCYVVYNGDTVVLQSQYNVMDGVKAGATATSVANDSESFDVVANASGSTELKVVIWIDGAEVINSDALNAFKLGFTIAVAA